MVWTRTLAQLVTDVTDRCDVAGSTARHPLATVRRHIVESYHAMREMMIAAGSKRFGAYYTLAIGTNVAPVSVGNGTVLRLASGTSPSLLPLEYPEIVEAYISGSWVALEATSHADADSWGTTGSPRAWCVTSLGGDPTTDQLSYGGMFSLLIVPAFDATVYPIRVWAAPVITVTDADATTLTLNGPGFEWIIWDTVIKISARDNDSANTFQIANIERQRVEKQIITSIRSETKTTAQRSDVFGRRRRCL